MGKVKVLAFAGSLRAESINKKLTKWAVNEMKDKDCYVTFIDLVNYPLPIYNPDSPSEQFPENALKLQALLNEHHAWLISSPEYNYSLTSALKNLVDWVSRAPDNKPNMSTYSNKIVGLMAASPSSFGGYRGIRHIREILTAVGCIVIPAQATIANAFNVFDPQGNLTDAASQKAVRAVIGQLMEITEKLVD